MSEEKKTLTGAVAWFNPQKGFGFIKQDDDNEKDMFIHYSNINSAGFKTLEEGQRVSYEVGENDKGPQAINVTVLE